LFASLFFGFVGHFRFVCEDDEYQAKMRDETAWPG